jgi:hypothetical protein
MCGGGHLHKECPVRTKDKLPPNCCNELCGVESVHLQGLQPCEGRAAAGVHSEILNCWQIDTASSLQFGRPRSNWRYRAWCIQYRSCLQSGSSSTERTVREAGRGAARRWRCEGLTAAAVRRSTVQFIRRQPSEGKVIVVMWDVLLHRNIRISCGTSCCIVIYGYIVVGLPVAS